MLHQSLPALVTCLALVLYMIVVFNTVLTRARHGIKAPATTGHPAFEIAYRVQLNTLEQLALFLPSLWLYAFFVSPLWAAALGGVWIVARAVYAWSYYRNPATRGPGFVVALAASLVLLAGSLAGTLSAVGRTGLFAPL